MKIYVESRGKFHNEEFEWHSLELTGGSIEERKIKTGSGLPDSLSRSGWNGLRHPDRFSFVFGKIQGQLALFAANFLASGKDLPDRTSVEGGLIRNSILWTYDDSEQNQDLFRCFVAALLTDDSMNRIKEVIHKSIVFSQEPAPVDQKKFETDTIRFKVTGSLELNSILNATGLMSRNLKAETGDKDFYSYKIIQNLSSLRDELANSLRTYSFPLDIATNVLVVSTILQPPSILKQFKVWRGFTTSSVHEGYGIYDPHRKSNSEAEKKKGWIAILIIVIAALLVWILSR